jgi:exodeoxyribonuclease VII large subunit
MMNPITLLDLNQMVRNRMRKAFPETYWIQAEVSECKEHYSGHCYLELIQKKEGTDTLCAKVRATIWANVWSGLKVAFESQTGARLQSGQKILVEVAVDFHELYGFSLVIRDIDPAFTVGDLSLRRREVLRQLTEDGVLELNKELEWPLLPQRLAIISSPSAAGYEDFMDQLHRNAYGLAFYTALFPAVVQGDAAPDSLVEALNRVLDSGVAFDAVVIIRGGGASADLSCFDRYELCYYAAQYPLPLLTGIGHDRDQSVLDLVANKSVKTPTAAAEFLLSCLSQEAYRLETNADRFTQIVQRYVEALKQRLQINSDRLLRNTTEGIQQAKRTVAHLEAQILGGSNVLLLQKKQQVEMSSTHLDHRVKDLLGAQKHRVELLQNQIAFFSPDIMFKKGFSLTLQQGKIVKSVKDLIPGAELQTRLSDGLAYSLIQKTETRND